MSSSHHCDILLVEDSSDDVFLFLRAARSEAPTMRVFPVLDAQIAQEFLCCTGRFAGRVDAIPPGLIVTDLRMPKMGGLEFVQWAHQQHFLKKVPIVVLSASDDPQDVQNAHEYGANCYIVKPPTADAYKLIVQSIAHYWCDNNVLPKGPFVRLRQTNSPLQT